MSIVSSSRRILGFGKPPEIAAAVQAKIILARGPEDVVPAIERVLGEG